MVSWVVVLYDYREFCDLFVALRQRAHHALVSFNSWRRGEATCTHTATIHALKSERGEVEFLWKGKFNFPRFLFFVVSLPIMILLYIKGLNLRQCRYWPSVLPFLMMFGS